MIQCLNSLKGMKSINDMYRVQPIRFRTDSFHFYLKFEFLESLQRGLWTSVSVHSLCIRSNLYRQKLFAIFVNFCDFCTLSLLLTLFILSFVPPPKSKDSYHRNRPSKSKSVGNTLRYLLKRNKSMTLRVEHLLSGNR